MGVTHRFLALEDESHIITEWFRSQTPTPVEDVREDGVLFFFRDFGPLNDDDKKSPLVNVFLPLRKRGVLLTCGEVHFLATPVSLFPQLAALNRQFRRWLGQFPCVFSRRPDFEGEWSYYLEGSIRNFDADVYALPEAMDALRSGSYFVSHGDTDWMLEKIVRQLDLRGVEGILPA